MDSRVALRGSTLATASFLYFYYRPYWTHNTYVADNRELSAQKRIFRLRFTFKNKKHDKDKQYYLVVYDEDTGLEQWRHPVMMDIAFADDFGFGF